MRKERNTLSIGGRIREKREQAKLSQLELSKMLLIKRERIVQWESDARQIKGGDIADLADALGTTCDYLLRGISTENLAAHKATGLSDTSINVLHDIDKSPHGPIVKEYTISSISILDDLINSPKFLSFIRNLSSYLAFGGALPADAYPQATEDLTVEGITRYSDWFRGQGYEIMPRKDVCHMYLEKACDDLRDIFKAVLEQDIARREKATEPKPQNA